MTAPSPSATPPLAALPSVPHIVPDPAKSYAPTRKIFTEADIPNWLDSEAYYYIELIIARLSVAVDGKTVEEPCHESEAVKACVRLLEDLTAKVDDVKLDSNPQRFGNKAFRDWLAMMEDLETPFQTTSILSEALLPILPELSHHFRTSFGSGPRLDYGTGHELSFLCYLLILRLVGVFTEQDEQAMVTRIFVAYIALVRKLQKVFKLEPAGSKGVWGLDDHQHLVYLWGASQLRTHPTLRPATILSPSTMSPLGISFMFLSSILHINDLKTGPFAEHSPMLHNIASTVPNWAKVNTGLTKMYRAEVLEKVPVVQHLRFGGVLEWRRCGSGEPMSSSGDHLDEEARRGEDEIGFKRERDEGTVAPWALPSLSHVEPTGPTPARKGAGTPPSPKPFVPPTLFPVARRPSLLRKSTGEETVGEQGGAAAASSPFGVLSKPTLGSAAVEDGERWKA